MDINPVDQFMERARRLASLQEERNSILVQIQNKEYELEILKISLSEVETDIEFSQHRLNEVSDILRASGKTEYELRVMRKKATR